MLLGRLTGCEAFLYFAPNEPIRTQTVINSLCSQLEGLLGSRPWCQPFNFHCVHLTVSHLDNAFVEPLPVSFHRPDHLLSPNILRYVLHSSSNKIARSQPSKPSRDRSAGCLRTANHWTDQSPAEPRRDNDLTQPHKSSHTSPSRLLSVHSPTALSGIALLIANPKSAIEHLESSGKLLIARGRACRKITSSS